MMEDDFNIGYTFILTKVFIINDADSVIMILEFDDLHSIINEVSQNLECFLLRDLKMKR